MKTYTKRNVSPETVRRHLEPGPIVLVTSSWRGKTNIMTMGWHMMMGFEPALVGAYIWDQNHSFGMIRKAKACAINVPMADMIDTVVGIGNCSGADTDKFEKFGLTARKAAKVTAPLIAECYASFECRLFDGGMIDDYSLFVWEVVAAHVSPTPKNPHTAHYRGDGEFVLAGEAISRKSMFNPEKL
jgi:flavin reductase (DIM6/NTAB) family NADH-FMN oxidoreductase RutF